MAANQGAAVHHKAISFQRLNWDKQEIRLLEIQPAKGEMINDALRCRLVNVRLTDDLEFIGLSTLFGDQTEDVYINGRRIPVPANLGQALRHVRAVFQPSQGQSLRVSTETQETQGEQRRQRPQAAGLMTSAAKRPPRWLTSLLRGVKSILPDPYQQSRDGGNLSVWVDSLCISTRDAKEMAQRKATMATVYQHAKLVVGWLGVKDETSDLVIETINTIDMAMPPRFGSDDDRREHPEHYAPHYVWMQDMMHLWTLPPGLQNLEEWPTYIAMYTFMSRPYFQREWILNEISMAKFPAFLLGDTILSWKQILRMNRATEELVDNGADMFPENFRKALNFFPLSTVYTLLGEFERRSGGGDDVSSSRTSIRSAALDSTFSRKRSRY